MKFVLPANVTVENITSPIRPRKETAFAVRFNGEVIGLVTKFQDTRGTWHPVKAFGKAPAEYAPRTVLGFFYAAKLGFGDDFTGVAPALSVHNPAQAALDMVVAKHFRAITVA